MCCFCCCIYVLLLQLLLTLLNLLSLLTHVNLKLFLSLNELLLFELLHCLLLHCPLFALCSCNLCCSSSLWSIPAVSLGGVGVIDGTDCGTGVSAGVLNGFMAGVEAVCGRDGCWLAIDGWLRFGESSGPLALPVSPGALVAVVAEY